MVNHNELIDWELLYTMAAREGEFLFTFSPPSYVEQLGLEEIMSCGCTKWSLDRSQAKMVCNCTQIVCGCTVGFKIILNLIQDLS